MVYQFWWNRYRSRKRTTEANMPMHAKQSGRSFAQGVMLVVTRLASLASLPCLMMAVASAPVSAADGQPEIMHGLIHYWSFDRTDDDGRRDNAGDIPLRNSFRKTGEWLVDGVAGEAAGSVMSPRPTRASRGQSFPPATTPTRRRSHGCSSCTTVGWHSSAERSP